MERTGMERKLTKTGATSLAALCCLSMWVGIGCSTDIDLTAPYERTPVVFSLLKQRKTPNGSESTARGWEMGINSMRPWCRIVANTIAMI